MAMIYFRLGSDISKLLHLQLGPLSISYSEFQKTKNSVRGTNNIFEICRRIPPENTQSNHRLLLMRVTYGKPQLCIF